MKYLIDSHYVADFLKGRQEALTLFRQLVPAGISISMITYAEAYEGIPDLKLYQAS
jgi:predicted nucleic acid-binding protein